MKIVISMSFVFLFIAALQLYFTVHQINKTENQTKITSKSKTKSEKDEIEKKKLTKIP